MSPTLRHTPPLTEAEQGCLPGATRSARVRLGTRSSALATTQAGWVADRLRAHGHHIDLVPVRTEGDASAAPLTEIGGTGVFAAALRQALLEDRVDIAVHSLKDLPVAPVPGLVIAAVPVREDPRDVVVARDGLTLAELPAGSIVGTGSPRRAAQLALSDPHLRVRDIRGNVDTRIRMVREGQVDAVVLAAAGLVRLGRTGEVSEVLEVDRMLPAPGQGALAVECRDDDEAMRAAGALLDDAATRACVRAERVLLSRLEAGCTAPVAAWARHTPDGSLELTGFADLAAGPARHTMTGTDPLRLGADLAAHLLAPTGRSTPPPAAVRRASPPSERDS